MDAGASAHHGCGWMGRRWRRRQRERSGGWVDALRAARAGLGSGIVHPAAEPATLQKPETTCQGTLVTVLGGAGHPLPPKPLRATVET